MSKKNPNLQGSGEAYLQHFNPPGTALTTSKAPCDISGGRREAEDFYQIPCKKLRVFSLKKAYDFSPWQAEKFTNLVESVAEFGILHPIIVRHHPEEEGFYEILAGEHRWKAAKQLDLKEIPGKILLDCDDEKAMAIFTLTNMMSRELSLEDKIQGWSHYYVLTRGKRKNAIAQLKQQGIIQEMPEVSKRQMLRYHKINLLPSALKKLVSEGKINSNIGEEFSDLPGELLNLLLPYSEKISSTKIGKAILGLHKGEYPGYILDEEGLEYLFSENFFTAKTDSFAYALASVKPVLKEKLRKEDYGTCSVLLAEALDFFAKYQGKDKLLEKALGEYVKNHPEESMLT